MAFQALENLTVERKGGGLSGKRNLRRWDIQPSEENSWGNLQAIRWWERLVDSEQIRVSCGVRWVQLTYVCQAMVDASLKACKERALLLRRVFEELGGLTRREILASVNLDDGNKGWCAGGHMSTWETSLHAVEDCIWDRHKVLAYQADWKGGVRGGVLCKEQWNRGPSCHQEDNKRIREHHRCEENVTWNSITAPSFPWKYYCCEGYHEACQPARIQWCVHCLRAHGHRPSPNHPLITDSHRWPLPVLHLPGKKDAGLQFLQGNRRHSINSSIWLVFWHSSNCTSYDCSFQLAPQNWQFCFDDICSCCEASSMYILQMFCIGIWSPVTCYWMQAATWRSVTLDWHARGAIKDSSWQSMLWHGGTEPLNFSCLVTNIRAPLTCGQWAAYLRSCWGESLFFLARTTSISWSWS